MQVQFTPEQHARLGRLARERGVSIAEVVRRCVDAALAAALPTRDRRYAAALEILGAFADREGADDVARDHDHHLQTAFGP